LSILVVIFNARPRLPELLESIFRQKADDVELVVIDGGSHDGTLEYLCTHEDQIDYWLSEPDRGIYDAMNKAVARATGTFLLHLNIGDALVEIPREELERTRNTNVVLLSFPVELSTKRTFRPSYGIGLRFSNTLHHQGTFYRRSIFPVYDIALKVFADFDVNQRLALSGAQEFIGQRVVAYHETDGVSAQRSVEKIAEFRSIVRKNYGRGALAIACILGKWRGLRAKVSIV